MPRKLLQPCWCITLRPVPHTTLCLQDVMFAFERSKLKEWVADIKALIKEDLRGIPGWGAHTR